MKGCTDNGVPGAVPPVPSVPSGVAGLGKVSLGSILCYT